MASTESQTDMGIGLGLLFSLVAIAAAVMTTVKGYDYAILHAQGLETEGLLVTGGAAFGIAMLAASLAVVVIHVYDM